MVAVLLASCLVTLVFWRVLPNSFRLNEQSDYFAFYEPVARSILAGRGLSREGENPATAYPPGYPMFLAAIFDVSHRLGISEEVSLAAVAVLGMGLASVFVFLLSRMLWGFLPALVSSAMWMTYPFALWLTKQPNSEMPFIVVLYGGLCLFWFALVRLKRARIYFWWGLLFGLALLSRPIAIGIALVLSVVVWFARRNVSPRIRSYMIVMLLLGNVLAVFPWETWVYARTGKVILLSTNGVKSMRDGLTFAVNTKGYREDISVSPDVAQVMKDILAQADQIASLGQLSSVMTSEFQSHPASVAKLSLLKIARSWYGTDSGRKEWPILLIQLVYLSLFIWSFCVAWKRGGVYRVFAMGSLLITVYFWAMTVLVLSILRYMVPAIGLLFVLVGGARAKRLSLRTNPELGTIR
jgi:4-amino-4-deoxy-L-arabinose transferase-like glycosyltransferase